MDINITVPGKAASKKLSISDETFGQKFNEALIHQVVTAYMAGGRAGTKAQKTRSEVSGGGRKPWRQKGTGRARAGTTRSPIWRSGGITFAAKPRDFQQKVNKKGYRTAMRSIFSELVRQDRLIATEDFTLDAPKTRDVVAKLKEFNLVDNVLIITAEADTMLTLATRNLPNVVSLDVAHINPVDLVGFGTVLTTVDALKKIEESI